MIEQLVESGSLEDYTRTWWDVRPHPRFGTVEVRVMDAVTRVDDAIALAAYVQTLVQHYAVATSSLSSGVNARSRSPWGGTGTRRTSPCSNVSRFSCDASKRPYARFACAAGAKPAAITTAR